MFNPYLFLFCFSISNMLFSQEYELQWSEDFEASKLDPEIWNYEKGFGKNNEKQFYTNRKENSRIENGILIIEAHKEEYNNARYTSARINTLNKKHFLYGRIEIKAKLPEGAGTWPAAWMLGRNHKTAGYPACGEIDILEHVGRLPGEVHGTVHYPNKSNTKMKSNTKEFKLTPSFDGFHLYSMEWDKDEIRFFVDNLPYHQFNIDDANRFGRKNPLRKPFYLILNLALGGKWAGKIEDSIFPVQFYIDYIKYYQLKDLVAD